MNVGKHNRFPRTQLMKSAHQVSELRTELNRHLGTRNQVIVAPEPIHFSKYHLNFLKLSYCYNSVLQSHHTYECLTMLSNPG